MTVDLGSANASIGLNYSGLESGIAASKGLISGLGGTLLGIAGVGVGIAMATTKMAGSFQSSLTSLVTGAGESQKNIGMVGDGIESIAVKTGESTKELTDGMFMIESAGYHGAAGLTVLTDAAEGAKVGNASLADVANGVTTEMTDYAKSGLTAAQATNELVASVAQGKTHMGDLANALANILPTSSAAGVGLTDVMGAMSTMTSEGIPAAQAATYLRQTILGLVAPSAGTVKALQSVGLTSDEVATEMKKSLPDALAMITDAVGKKFPVGSAAYVQAIKDISGGSKTMQGMLDLTGDHMKTFEGDVKNITGTVQTAGSTIQGWALVQQDFNTKMDQAKEAVEVLGIKVGTALLPVAGRLFDIVTPLVSGFGDWITNSGGLKQAFDALTPIGQGISTTFDGIESAVKSPEFANLAGTVKNLFAPAFQLAGDTLKNVFQPAMNALSGSNVATVSTDLRTAAESANVFVEGIQGFQDGSSGFEQAGTKVHDVLMQVGTDAQVAWGYIVQVGTYLEQTFTPTWQQMVTTFNDQVVPAWNDLTSSLGNMPGLLDMAKGLAEGVVIYFGIAAKGIATAATDITTAFGGVVQTMSGLVTAAAGAGTTFHDVISGNFARVGTDVEGAWTGIIDITRGALNVIDGLTGGMFSNVLSLFGTSMPKLTSSWGSGTKSIVASTGAMKGSVEASVSNMSSDSLNTIQVFTSGATAMLGKMGKDGTAIMASLDQSTILYWNDIAGYIDLKSAEAAMTANENFGKIHINSGIALKNINDSSTGDMTGHASGIIDSPTGHWAMVGERGPEPMFVPKHASILPHGTDLSGLSGSSSSSSSSGGGSYGGGSSHASLLAIAREMGKEIASALASHQTLLSVDGQVLGQAVVQHMRVLTGTRS